MAPLKPDDAQAHRARAPPPWVPLARPVLLFARCRVLQLDVVPPPPSAAGCRDQSFRDVLNIPVACIFLEEVVGVVLLICTVSSFVVCVL